MSARKVIPLAGLWQKAGDTTASGGSASFAPLNPLNQLPNKKWAEFKLNFTRQNARKAVKKARNVRFGIRITDLIFIALQAICERIGSMSDLTAAQARQTVAAADASFEKVRWLVIHSVALRDELRRLSRDSFLAGLRQGEQCRGEA